MRSGGFLWALLHASIAVCGLFAISSHAANSVIVKDVRLWAGPDSTRVVLDLTGPAQHTLLTLQDPARVVLDIEDARVAAANLVLPDGRGFAKQLRVGTQGANDLRLVIDLSGPATPRSFSVEPNGPYGHRLVLDLTPGSASTPLPSTPVAVKSAPTSEGRDIVVAIDAGHGGQDPGSIGKRGTYEKHVTLQIARRLKEVIDREPGMRAELTRDGDYFLPHRERMLRARRKQADMFISVHADSYHDRSVAGSSVYTLSARGASDESARWLADRENAADLVGGVSLDDKDAILASVLLDLSQSASMSASIDAAGKVMSELVGLGNTTNRGVKHAGFLVLKSPDIPSILVETAFISNPGEEARLLDSKHQRRLAEAIHAGVRTYFLENPPPGTRFAQVRFKQNGSTVIASAAGGDGGGTSASGMSP
jgi:N-acetylmuramoyl-L-alanine amidase